MSCPVNMVSFFTLNSINSVNSRTYHVEQPSFDLVTYRHSDGRSCIGHFHAPNQAVGRIHRDGPYAIFSEMLLTFQYQYFAVRSEEHTSELQSLMRISYAVFCLKKKHKEKHNKY